MENEASVITFNNIVEKSKQWTLEGDCSLLQWMNNISKNLEERALKTTNALNDLSINLDRTSISLDNVTNNLAALQYSQFVENRVHDDDETLANMRDVPNTDVTEKKDATQNAYAFLKKNLEMMNSCHEAYSISYEDSDEDEPSTNVVYRSKNPYEARSLPHIYGSNLWKEKWHIGLCDSDNDFSGDENSEQFSESSSSPDDSYESTAPTLSEWDSTAWGLNTNHLADRKESHTPSNDGESSYHGENSQSVSSTPTTKKNLPIVQPIQDQRYYQHIPRRQENLFDDIFTEPKQPTEPQVSVPPQKSVIQESYIPNEPPPDIEPSENDSNRRVGAKKTLNLFDDDEFNSFMDQIVQTATNKGTKDERTETDRGLTKKRSPDLFDETKNIFNKNATPTKPTNENKDSFKKGQVTDLFNESKDIFTKNSKFDEPEVVSQELPKSAVIPNLFDDAEKVFKNVRIQSPPTDYNKPTSKITAPNLFTDSDDLFRVSDSITENKKPSKTVPNLFEDTEDIFSSTFAKPSVIERKPSLSKQEVSKPSLLPAANERNKIRNLFDDVDDDDDFDSIFLPKRPESKNNTQIKNLFEEDLEDVSKQPQITSVTEKDPREVKEASAKEVPLIKKGLFDDFIESENEDDMFAKIPTKTNIEKDSNVQTDPQAKPQGNIGISSLAKTDLFSDVFRNEPLEDVIAFPNTEKKNQIADIFADDFVDDFDEITPKSKTESINKEKESLKVETNEALRPVEDRKESDNKSTTISSKIEDLNNVTENTIEKDDFFTEKLSNNVLDVSDRTQEKSLNSSNEIDESLSNQSDLFSENNAAPSTDLSQIEQNTEIVKKSMPVTNYSSLFQDELPPEYDPQVIQSNEPSPMHNIDNEIQTTSATKPYNSINLFADVPPDDDDFVPIASQPGETKRIHSIFYDDFNETREAGRDMKGQSTYIFNEEPPPDDNALSSKDLIDDKPGLEEIKSDKPKISKLKKTDLQINVGALLPTAKIPLFKKTEPISVSPMVSQSENVRCEEPSVPATIKQPLPENMLPNLNRDRAKFQVKRRPSTRKGRQESYRKSMIDEKMEAMGSDEIDEKNINESKKQLFSEDSFPPEKSIQSNIAKEPSPSIFSIPIMSKLESTALSKSPTKLPSLFDDSDIESRKEDKKIQNTIESPTNKNTDTLFSDGIDENPFGTPKKVDIEETVKPVATEAISFPNVSNSSEVSQATSSKFKMPEPLKSLKLFDESDENSDDLFKTSNVAKKSIQQKPIAKNSKTKLSTQPVKPSKSSLFSSDEETGSGDDIFGKTKTKILSKKIETTKNKKSSTGLFDDLSDDEDDDLFGTTKTKPSGAAKSKSKSVTPKLQPTKTSALAQQDATKNNNPLSDLLGP